MGPILQKLDHALARLTREATEAIRGCPTGHRSFGLTVLEAGNLRSPNGLDMGIYDLGLASRFQNWQKRRNRTKIEGFLLVNQG